MNKSYMPLFKAADKAGMSEKTARKYTEAGKGPEELKIPHTWKTRKDSFSDVFKDVEEMLENHPGLEAKAIFEWLCEEHPGKFSTGQLRSFQRRVKQWKCLFGKNKEVYFSQEHKPGQRGQSDFTCMNKLEITVGGKLFKHLVYHFVLTYSNWETGSICYSESFESLCEGLQNALWDLGGVPQSHQTDSLTAAVQKIEHPEEFTRRYESLLKHYSLEGKKTNPGCPNENGDVEQRHFRLKNALKQALMLRGNRDFASVEEYQIFLRKMFAKLNASRQERFLEEVPLLKPLPLEKLANYKRLKARVSKGSTISVLNNVYSVHSRLIGQSVDVYVYAQKVEIYYGQKKVETLPRLQGRKKHNVDYKHVIESLVRKPSAFANYLYKEDLFPTSRFRLAYDQLHVHHVPSKADRSYLQFLYMANKHGESLVDQILAHILEHAEELKPSLVEEMIGKKEHLENLTDVHVKDVDLSAYNQLIRASREDF